MEHVNKLHRNSRDSFKPSLIMYLLFERGVL